MQVREGYHNALKSLYLCKHPSIWKFLSSLKKDIAIHRLTIQNANLMIFETTRNKYKELSERLREKVRNYYYEQDKLNYLRAISHMN